jgi:hypothetical protein
VTGIEDTKQPAVELLAIVHRRERDLVGQPAGARLADPAAAEIVAPRLGSRGRLERRVNQRVDPDADVADCAQSAVDEARA